MSLARCLAGLAFAAGWIGAISASAMAGGAPVAIVEEVSTGVTQVEPMDLLSEGDRIELKADQTVIIGYFSTCMREVVHGGKIVVGKAGSDVDGGEAVAKKMKCAAGTMDLTPEQLAQTVAFTFTDGDRGAMTREEILLHVITHGGYHRGNVGQLLKAIGMAPPRELYTRFLHLREPQRRG